MPELPEVETTLNGIKKHIQNQKIKSVNVYQHKLRYRIPKSFSSDIEGQKILNVSRRGKYLIFKLERSSLLAHLGMSGSIRVHTNTQSVPEKEKHDHLDFFFSNGYCLRYNDPRRFGLWLPIKHDYSEHPLIKNLGPEPLSNQFTAIYLANKAQKRKSSIKSFLMNSKIVVGIGNIYASEILFLSLIKPDKPVHKINNDQFSLIVKNTKKVLKQAIKQGGTSLKDFVNSDGKKGYFKQKLNVYGREGLDCLKCKEEILCITICQRSTYYCSSCQS